ERVRAEQLARLLRRMPLFARLGETDLLAIVGSMRRVGLKKGLHLFSEGDAGNAAYFVGQGQVQRLIRTVYARELSENEGGPGEPASALLGLEDHAEPGEPITVTHEHLAGLVGTSRQTTTLILNEWKREGIVELGRQKITLLDRKRLAARATPGHAR